MEEDKILYKDLSYTVQGAFFEVYKAMGNAFKEVAYQNALSEEFLLRKLKVEPQKRIPIFYKEKKVGIYIPDFVVDKKILIEIKSKEFFTPNDKNQFWYYLRGSEYKVGYLVNFGAKGKVEIHRRVYDTAREK